MARLLLNKMRKDTSRLDIRTPRRRADVRRAMKPKEQDMSKKNVEELLIAGGADEKLRNKYDALKTKEEFVALAKGDGYEFSVQDLDDVLRESGDSFESFGNPAKRVIWWQ